ncbi:MAG: hypothetical protein ACLFRP_08465 [Puniceicoccaceae bacterium]
MHPPTRKPLVKWLFIGTLTTVAAVFALIYFGSKEGAAAGIHVHLGYYFCLTLFVCWLYFLWRAHRRPGCIRWMRRRWRGLLLALVAGLSLQVTQEHRFRVFNDEPAHQMVARSMHELREISVPEVGYLLEGQLEFGERSVSYRMYFYPFLVSLVHDLTGFRVGNGLIVNGVLGIGFFLLVYLIGVRFHPAGGVFLVLLAATLPLLDISATSWGYDLTNLTFLAALFLASAGYLERPDRNRLNLLIATSLIASMCRNESVLLLPFPALVIAYAAYRRRGRIPVSRFAAVSPFFLLPALSAHWIFRAFNPAGLYSSWGDDGFFVLPAIPGNFVRVAFWLFDFSPTTASSPLVSFFGLLGLVFLLTKVSLSLSRRAPVHPRTVLVLLFCVVAFPVYVFVFLGQFWNPLAGEAVRFLLPAHLLFLILAGWWLGNVDLNPVVLRFSLILLGAAVFLFGLPARATIPRGNNAAFGQHAQWAVRWLDDNDDGSTLYVSPLNSFFLLYDHPTIGSNRANRHVRELMHLVREGYYDRVLGFVIERYDPREGRWSPVEPAPPLSGSILTTPVDERRFAYNMRARFFEIRGFLDEDGNEVRPGDLPYLKDRDYESFLEYYHLMRSIHPAMHWRP